MQVTPIRVYNVEFEQGQGDQHNGGWFEFFEWLLNATLTAGVISWRGRPDKVVAVGLDPKNSSGGALKVAPHINIPK